MNELPVSMTSPGATNTILRADWIISGCCASSTFNFNNIWTRVKSAACMSVNLERHTTRQRKATPHYEHAIDLLCPDPAINNAPVVVGTEQGDLVHSVSSFLYLTYRLLRITNRVVKTNVTCDGNSSVRFLFQSTYVVEFKSAQLNETSYSWSQVGTPSNSCFVGITYTNNIYITEANNWATVDALTSNVWAFPSTKTYTSLTSVTGTVNFCQNTLSCTTAPGCVSQNSTVYPSVTFNTIPVYDGYTAENGTPSSYLESVRTLNLWPRSPTAYYAQWPMASYAETSITQNDTNEWWPSAIACHPDGCFVGPNAVGNFPDTACRKRVQICGSPDNNPSQAGLPLWTQVLGCTVTASTVPFSLNPYIMKSVSFSESCWDIVFP
jgi:hypothetical protein